MIGEKVVVERQDFQKLLDALRQQGYQTIGPTLRQGAIVYDQIAAVEDLPIGWTDEQDGGTYRLKKRDDQALFGYVVGPHSWKKFLHPPVLSLWKAKKNGKSFEIVPDNSDPPQYAFIGVRACELHAIAIQDRVFTNGKYVDPIYKARRERAFIVAVNCVQAGGTCFCVSMKTGPKATAGFDLALTEIIVDNERHYFVVEIGTEQGVNVLQRVPNKRAQSSDVANADERVQQATQQMGRHLDTTDIKDLLYRNLEHPRWDEVATRCLNCTNCTMVCPTCFCTTVEDVTDLTGQEAERVRKWDSCFTMDFSYVHGGSVRASPKARYRQWLTHKLASWIDQFGTSGCVGCGRCITWCPVAIDITEEVRAIRESELSKA
jgi:formate hydrogenlyase subunit 6/NADH:ubiquinone oxidoreductase subunit I